MPENQAFLKNATLPEDRELHLIHRFPGKFDESHFGKWLKSTVPFASVIVHLFRRRNCRFWSVVSGCRGTFVP